MRKRIVYSIAEEVRCSKVKTVLKLSGKWTVCGQDSEKPYKVAPKEQYRFGRISQVNNTEEDDKMNQLSSLLIF